MLWRTEELVVGKGGFYVSNQLIHRSIGFYILIIYSSGELNFDVFLFSDSLPGSADLTVTVFLVSTHPDKTSRFCFDFPDSCFIFCKNADKGLFYNPSEFSEEGMLDLDSSWSRHHFFLSLISLMKHLVSYLHVANSVLELLEKARDIVSHLPLTCCLWCCSLDTDERYVWVVPRLSARLWDL